MKLFSITKLSKRPEPEADGLNELANPTPSIMKTNDGSSDTSTKQAVENIRADSKVVFEDNGFQSEDTSQAILVKNEAVKEYIATQMADLGLPAGIIRDILNLK